MLQGSIVAWIFMCFLLTSKFVRLKLEVVSILYDFDFDL